MAITLHHWDNDKLKEDFIRPSFELAFVYDRYEGELDICCIKGGNNFRKKMEIAFSKAILSKEIDESTDDDQPYDLPSIFRQLICDKRVDFCLKYSDNLVKDAFIRSIRLKSKYNNEKITLDTGLKERKSGIFDDIAVLLENHFKINELSTNKISIDDFELHWIECRVFYYDKLTKKMAKKKFNISGNSGCNLGFDGIDKIIRECLKQAKIELVKSA